MHRMFTFLMLVVFVANTCTNKDNPIIGSWKASFWDSLQCPNQYLFLTELENDLQLFIDEPAEDWYGVPVEKSF